MCYAETVFKTGAVFGGCFAGNPGDESHGVCTGIAARNKPLDANA
jgi:hypothetical protein